MVSLKYDFTSICNSHLLFVVHTNFFAIMLSMNDLIYHKMISLHYHLKRIFVSRRAVKPIHTTSDTNVIIFFQTIIIFTYSGFETKHTNTFSSS